MRAQVRTPNPEESRSLAQYNGRKPGPPAGCEVLFMLGSSITASSVIALASVLGIIFAGMFALLCVVRREPTNNPGAYLRKGKRQASTTVVCAGDSHTHASLSSDYVTILRGRLGRRGFAFINAGRNGNTSLDLLRRLPEIVRCEPDAVTVLIGTNDARTGFSELV